MGLSPLAQLLIVAALAYGAGLLLGLSFYRGEIGPGRRAVALPTASAAGNSAQSGRRRRSSRTRSFQERLGERTRQAVVLLFMLAFITVLGLGFYSVMGAGADALSHPGGDRNSSAKRSIDGRS
jgi:hypothetical protein